MKHQQHRLTQKPGGIFLSFYDVLAEYFLAKCAQYVQGDSCSCPRCPDQDYL